jgi:peptidase M23-like protein
MDDLNSPLMVLPHNLFVSKLPNGEKEFFCFICFPNGIDQTKHFSWRITSNKDRSAFIGGERLITDKECEQCRVSIAVILSTEFVGGELTVSLAPYQKTWQIQSYDQKGKFRLPLNGQVLVLIGLKRPLSENLEAQDFEGFGQPILTPASGLVVKAVDGMADLARVGELPTNLDYYQENLTRALGNHVIIDHGEGVWSCLAHLKNGSVQVKEGQRVEVSDKLGELGNSGFSSGPHVHLHFMNGPDILSTSPLPIELDLEGGTYAPQAGEITSS